MHYSTYTIKNLTTVHFHFFLLDLVLLLYNSILKREILQNLPRSQEVWKGSQPLSACSLGRVIHRAWLSTAAKPYTGLGSHIWLNCLLWLTASLSSALQVSWESWEWTSHIKGDSGRPSSWLLFWKSGKSTGRSGHSAQLTIDNFTK